MKPSEIKLITSALEAKGYQINKSTSYWDNKVQYTVEHKNGNYLSFKPSDNQTIQSLIDEQLRSIGYFLNEKIKYEKMLENGLVDMELFNNEYSTMKLHEIWDAAKNEYEKRIQSHIKQTKEIEEIIADLQEILAK